MLILGTRLFESMFHDEEKGMGKRGSIRLGTKPGLMRSRKLLRVGGVALPHDPARNLDDGGYRQP